MMRKSEVGSGVFITDVTNEGIKEVLIVGDLSVFDVFSNNITEKPAEVFVTWIGEKRPGVSQHPDEAGEKSYGGKGLQVVRHSPEGVIIPPCGTPLDSRRGWSFLERATRRGEKRVISGIQVVEDGFGKRVSLMEAVEELK
jgi:hypothetical protein